MSPWRPWATRRSARGAGSSRLGRQGATRTDASIAGTSPDYATTLGVALLAGRTFDERHTLQTPRVRATMAAWPGGALQ
jgi:hypothetical protein